MNQKNVWNSVADSWSNYRQKPIKETEELKKYITNRKINILDIGCGNCRNLIPFQNNNLFGVDFSVEMLKKAEIFCRRNNMKVNLVLADASALPFKSNSFDIVLYLATLHNLNEKQREQSLKQIKKILNGFMLISVWNRWQPRFLKCNLLNKKDIYVSWHKKNKIYLRYYHLFSKTELERFVKKSGLKIIKIFGDKRRQFKLFSRNIFILVKN